MLIMCHVQFLFRGRIYKIFIIIISTSIIIIISSSSSSSSNLI
jgi:hypothetical protein